MAMQNATRKGWMLFLVLFLLAPITTSAQDSSPLVHTVREGDNLIKICGKYRHLTNHYSLTDLLTDIRVANKLKSNFLKIGQQLVIPVLEMEDETQVSDRVSSGAEVRGIYLTGPACGVSSVLRRVDAFIEAGGNAVVFDAKDIDGGVSYLSRHPLASWGAGRTSPVISSLDDMIQRFDRRGLYITARIALFLDGELGRRRPDLALQDPQGNPWVERDCSWIDPAKEEVIEYNLALAEELARAGVHEIQFDYMRFPTNGWYGDDQGDLASTAERRRQVIEAFLIQARSVLAPYDVRISADLFGIMAWGRVEDLALTGQHVPTIAAQVDVICPMIYPSHFGQGFEGRRRPGDDPAYFVGEGTRRFLDLAAGQAEIRPWLQAFPFRVTRYDEEYIRIQIAAAGENGGNGWCLWNPTCRYTVALNAMRTPEPISSWAVDVALTPEENAELEAASSAPDSRPIPVLPAQSMIQVMTLPALLQGSGIQEHTPDP